MHVTGILARGRNPFTRSHSSVDFHPELTHFGWEFSSNKVANPVRSFERDRRATTGGTTSTSSTRNRVHSGMRRSHPWVSGDPRSHCGCLRASK
jgi:hypothetical protein